MNFYGDIKTLSGYELPVVDCITGGSPCQDLSVAGKRAGLDGERSGLFMEQIRIVKEMRERDRRTGRSGWMVRPRYMVWENVPGTFSSNHGQDFQAVLTEIVRIADPEAPDVPMPDKGRWDKSGCLYSDMGDWSVAWRIHDAQFWGVPQRRKRIALVADFGGMSAAEVLFERKGLSGDTQPRGAAGEEAAGGVGDGVASTITATYGTKWNGNAGAYSGGNFVIGDGAASAGIGVDVYNQEITGCGGTNTSGPKALPFQERAGKPGGGKGILIQDEHVGALSTLNNQSVFCLQGNGIDRADTAGCNGRGWCEDVSYTLNTIDRPAVYEEPVLLESNQNHAAVHTDGISTALPASAGMGGGYVPMIVEPICVEMTSTKNTIVEGGIGYQEEVSPSLKAAPSGSNTVPTVLSIHQNASGEVREGEVAYAIGTNANASGRNAPLVYEQHSQDARYNPLGEVCETVSAKYGTGGNNQPIVVLPFDTTQITSPQNGNNPHYGDPCHPLAAGAHPPAIVYEQHSQDSSVKANLVTYQQVAGTLNPGAHPGSYNGQDAYNDMLVVFDKEMYNCGQKMQGEPQAREDDVAPTVRADSHPSGVSVRKVVRRLTPLECERLQGYPDGWTDIGEWIDSKGKKHKEADSPRYKALGNSIALPFWFYLLRRISAQYERPATLGSLFDGIGGFPLCWERCNGQGTALWTSEIEEFPIAVVKRHFGGGNGI